VLGALGAAIAGAPGQAAGNASSSGSFTAIDFAWQATGGGTSATIAPGGAVTFSYPTGMSEHNADFGKGPHPAACTQTAGPSSGRVPPLPGRPTSAGWGGTCTFNAPGTYRFHCDLHPFMTGTIVVQGSAGSPFARRPSKAVAIRARQRGTAVRGTLKLSSAASGGMLELDVRASANSLGRGGSRPVRVGRLTRSQLRPGAMRFTVALDAAGRRAERSQGKLTVTVQVLVRPPGRRSASLMRRVVLSP
jgi:hypothetical protein